MSALAASLMEQLTRNFLWMRALATTPALDKEVRFRHLLLDSYANLGGRASLAHKHRHGMASHLRANPTKKTT